jgi:hypothetical protein
MGGSKRSLRSLRGHSRRWLMRSLANEHGLRLTADKPTIGSQALDACELTPAQRKRQHRNARWARRIRRHPLECREQVEYGTYDMDPHQPDQKRPCGARDWRCRCRPGRAERGVQSEDKVPASPMPWYRPGCGHHPIIAAATTRWNAGCYATERGSRRPHDFRIGG